METYKDPSLALEHRVDDLLSMMTLKEKIGQLNQKLLGWQAYERVHEGYQLTDAFRDEVTFGDGIGALYGLFRADPWSGVSFGNGISAADSPKITNQIQQYVRDYTRLGIPVLFSEECPHGHQALDGTVFPVNLGIGSTWNPVLYQEAFSQVAREIRARGAHLGLVSALDVLRDPRWGRSEECYSEDPYLVSVMAAAVVRALQGESREALRQPDRVVAVLKHFCAQGTPVGGHNAWPANIGERELREIFLPGMVAGIQAGAVGCMAAYNEIDGIPCHANRRLLTDILRAEFCFDGFVMSDGQAVDMLVPMSGDYESAAAMAVHAGVDLNLWNTSFLALEDSVTSGKVAVADIDEAVRRVLRTKFSLGLFECPFTDETIVLNVVGRESAKQVNLDVARESVVLLKNQNNQLPLSKKLKRIAVIGPNADALYNQLGDYTAPQRTGTGSTVLQGIASLVSTDTDVVYHKGCGIRDMSRDGLHEAVQSAACADVAIVVVGGSSARDFGTKFLGNGAAIIGDDAAGEMDCGEGVDVAELELGGRQTELLCAIRETGTPMVVVLIQGRPHAVPWIAEHSDAVLCAWYPGSEGGQAIAEILFGDVNPSAKLPVTIPRSSAQLPMYYNVKNAHALNYVDMTNAPLYPFGFGLSYTTVTYSNLRVNRQEISVMDLKRGDRVEVSVDVQNAGPMAGSEIVQLYICGVHSTITRRVRELKAFQKVRLESGERHSVVLSLEWNDLAVWNQDMEFVVESGDVQVFVGEDSTSDRHVTLKITR